MLVASQLLSGLGVASGIAVSGLLAQQLTHTVALAGLAQTSSVLGAGIWAIPLARLAARRSRRWSLAAGYLLAVLGGGVVLLSAGVDSPVLMFVGAGFFGAATAAALQARFAATEVTTAAYRARALSVVLWATTLGSVAGPNLAEAGGRTAGRLGIAPLTGPYLFSVLAFAVAAVLIMVCLRVPQADSGSGRAHVGIAASLRVGWSRPGTRLAMVAIACSHTIMVGVMVMTPVQMQHHGMTLGLVGVVISIHILGMYGASPLMGWLTDKISPTGVLAVAVGILIMALSLAALSEHAGMLLLTLALGLLGLGWSAGVIGGSTLLTEGTDPDTRLSVQGASDAIMNLVAAAATALSGLVLGWGGFPALAGVAALVLVPMAILVARGLLARPGHDAVATPLPDGSSGARSARPSTR